jgi:pimeloyl-ACP methyl ester carboxylesterase
MTATAQTSISPFAGHADLPGVRLWYTDSGGECVPVILLHANTGNADSWQYNIPGFVEAGFRVSRSIAAAGAAALRIGTPVLSPAPSQTISMR